MALLIQENAFNFSKLNMKIKKTMLGFQSYLANVLDERNLMFFFLLSLLRLNSI